MPLTNISLVPAAVVAEPEVTIVTKCMIDDVNSDGTLLVSYVNAYGHSVTGGVLSSSMLGSYQDETLSVAYSPVNPTDPCSIGSAASITPRYHRIEGAEIFSIPGTAVSYSVTVCAIGNTVNPPILDDGVEQTALDKVGFVATGNADSSLAEGYFSSTPAIITQEAGDVLIISWNEVS